MKKQWVFFREFLRHPLQVGSVIPSSGFLKNRIVEAAGLEGAESVVEIGPGTGGTSVALLRHLPSGGRLLTIELNPTLHRVVDSIADGRLAAHLGDAEDMVAIAREHDLPAPDAVVSGIPFSQMPEEAGRRVIDAIHALLKPKGRFVAYQFSRRVAELAEPVFGKGGEELEYRNVPPIHVFRWTKSDT